MRVCGEGSVTDVLSCFLVTRVFVPARNSSRQVRVTQCGILRCAQNDKRGWGGGKKYMRTATATAKANAGFFAALRMTSGVGSLFFDQLFFSFLIGLSVFRFCPGVGFDDAIVAVGGHPRMCMS